MSGGSFVKVTIIARLRATDFGKRLWPSVPLIDKNTAILWEPCSRNHGEVVPGYAKILLDLGYRVVVLMTPDRLDEGLFSRFEHPRLVLSDLSQGQISKFVRTPAAHQAAVVVVTTVGKLPHASDLTVDIKSVFGRSAPPPLVMVEHDAQAKIDAGSWTHNIATLRALDYRGATSTVINPHYFGDVRITPKSSGKTIFLMIGAARDKRRNQNVVYDAVRNAVTAGRTNFEIRIIGKKGTHPIPPAIAPYVKEFGRLSFADMYAQIEECDFILTAFQAANPDHTPYRTVKTTGSFQLCYGFQKPCIVHKDFARGTYINADNSLFYADDADLARAMQAAILMDAKAYHHMQNAMARDADALYRLSVDNMQGLIDG